MKWNSKNVLVVGGFGFIGQNLVKKLVELNANVLIVDDFSGKQFEKKSDVSKVIQSSTYSESFVTSVKEDIDIIFHFGAPSSVILFNENPPATFNNTIVGFLNVLSLARDKKVEKVVYPSSGSVYGSTPPPQSENTIPKPLNLYAIAKLTCEQIAMFYSDTKSVGLRIFAGYGPGEDHKGQIASPITLFLKSILENKPPIVFGNGTQTRDFVYISDVVEAVIKSAEKETPPVINVGTGKSHSFNDVIKMINEVLGKNIPPQYVNKPTKYLENTLADTSMLKKVLDITPLTLEEGLEKYVETCNLLNHSR